MEEVFQKLKRIGEVELGHAPVVVGVMKSLSIHEAKRAKESGAAVIELRIDLLENEEKNMGKVKEFVTMLKNFQSSVQMPIIVTNRKKEEGGSFVGTEAKRIGMLNSILETAEVDAVDIEFFSPAELKKMIIEKAKSLHIPVIFSFHDFKGMPSREDLLAIIARMYEEGGSIAKIAVTPKTPSDALLLLALTHKVSSEGKLLVTIGMGPVGRHLRVIAPLYGSALTYGFMEGEEGVAPGQFSVKELRNMLLKIQWNFEQTTNEKIPNPKHQITNKSKYLNSKFKTKRKV
ncbi:MAG: type I 3-dehydroquinate dehydratase [Methanophagales archaeon]|nr:type I 3-dehydroquinate dehydratase [Methanophagales archaeon]